MVELNLALKKDIFEALQNKTSNEIPIKRSDWWKKRLTDPDTGRFKWFDVVVASSGSSDKYRYEIDHIETRGDYFVIMVVLDKPIEDKPQDVELEDSDVEFDNVEVKGDIINPDIIEPESANPEILELGVINKVTINGDEVETEPKKVFISEEHKKAIIEKFTKQVAEKQEITDVRESILKLFDKFCKMPDVYVVNLPHVTIRNSGMVMGCNRRLLADRDSDVRIDFKRVEITQNIGMSDEMFLAEIKAYLENTLKNSYVFVNKKYAGFAVSDFGELIFKLAIVPKKKYLFIRK